jgi:peptide chain release factor subunit 3
LWQACLRISNGDRAAARKLLDDPDALMQYPEIRKIMESGAEAEAEAEGWEQEKDGDTAEAAAVVEAAAPVETVVAKKEKPVKAAPVVQEEDPAEDDAAVTDGDPREHLNIVFIGHVDAGKSTLSGSILYIMGKVDQRTIERYEREAKDRNRESWWLAFIMDTSEEERAKGKTVEVGRAQFETDKNRYTILDAPGHKNYVPNMISGAAQADVGVLVISARRGEFETGFEKGGQTREHALLAKTIGVKYLVVVINKMDDPTVEWDKGRYEECVGKLKPYLNKQCGYVIKNEVKFIPISGLAGDNVLNEVSADKCPWWRELHTSGAHNTTTPTLISTLDSLQITGRNADGPLRVPCLDRYFERGCNVLGKVESGTLRVGEEIVIAPTKKRSKVDAIYINDVKVRSAKPGENVVIKFGINVEDIQKGYILCGPSNVCPAVTEFLVQLQLVDLVEHRPIFSPGYDAIMHVHTAEVEVTCVSLESVTIEGRLLKRPFAKQGQNCVARMSTPLLTCFERFDDLQSLGRVTLRDEGKTIAIGKILKLRRQGDEEKKAEDGAKKK